MKNALRNVSRFGFAVAITAFVLVAAIGASNVFAQAAPAAPTAQPIAPAAATTPGCTDDSDCSSGDVCKAGACITPTQPGSVALGDECEDAADCTRGTFCGKSGFCVASKDVDAALVAQAKKDAAQEKADEARAAKEAKAQAVVDASEAVEAAKKALADDVADCATDSSKCDQEERTKLEMSVKDSGTVLAAARVAATPPVAPCDPSKSKVCAFQTQAKHDGHYKGSLDGKVGKGTCEAAANYSGVEQEVVNACEEYASKTVPKAAPAATAGAPHGSAGLAASGAGTARSAPAAASDTTIGAIPAAWVPILEAQRKQGAAINRLVDEVGQINGRLNSLETWKRELEAERARSTPRS